MSNLTLSSLLWKNFTRDDPRLPDEFRKFSSEFPIYTSEEFISINFQNISHIFSNRNKYVHISFLRYSPTSTIENEEYAKCNYAFDLYRLDIKPLLITDFSIIPRKNQRRIALFGEVYL